MPIKIAHILNSNVANAIIGEITIPNTIPIKTIKNRINFVFLLIILLIVLKVRLRLTHLPLIKVVNLFHYQAVFLAR